MRQSAFLMVVVLVAGWQGLFAQSAGETRSIEELYLESGVSVEMLARQLRSPERTVQLLAIETLSSQVEGGTAGGDEAEIIAALEPVIARGVMEVHEDNSWEISTYDPMVRREAIRVVGRLESEGARTVLVRTVRHDPEPIVRAQALFGLARMGYDPDGEVTRTIGKMLLREHVGSFDEGVVYAGILAIREIARNSASTVDPSSLEMLVYVASDGRYPRRLRNLALEALSIL